MTNKMEKVFPALYILMRTDMASMNAGKGMAQASHAANAFIHAHSSNTLVNMWASETTQGFGTAIVLGVDISTLENIISSANEYGIINDVVIDPSYPMRDGDVTHFLNIITCGYVFGDKNDPIMQWLLGGLSLHP